jgi:hypothetical protein
MAKGKTNISDLLKTQKTGGLSPEAVEEATKKIKPIQAKEKEEKTKRLSIDTPLSLYIELKKRVAEEDVSVREFVIEQIRKGLNK